MIYPGIDNIEEKHIFRTIGKENTKNQLGFGFMHKHGKSVDEKDSSFSFYSVVFVLRGKGLYIDNAGNEFKLNKGSIFQRFPGMRHSTYIQPESLWSECYIDFGKDIFKLLKLMGIVNTDTPVISGENESYIEKDIFELMNQLEVCEEHALPDMLLKSMTLLRRQLIRNNKKNDNTYPYRIINKSCSYFANNIHKRIDLRKYCITNGWGYESFRKIFKNYIGISPGKYIVRRRIDVACQYLRGSEKSIGEISIELGYRSPYEFSAQFKRMIGISPLVYRENR